MNTIKLKGLYFPSSTGKANEGARMAFAYAKQYAKQFDNLDGTTTTEGARIWSDLDTAKQAILKEEGVIDDLFTALEDAEFLMRKVAANPKEAASMVDSFKRSAEAARAAIAKATK